MSRRGLPGKGIEKNEEPFGSKICLRHVDLLEFWNTHCESEEDESLSCYKVELCCLLSSQQQHFRELE